MKKRALIIAAQLFQIMVAWHIRNTKLRDNHVDLILIDSSTGVRDIYERLSQSNYFDNVYLVKNEIYKNYAHKIQKAFFSYVFDKRLRYLEDFDFEPEYSYDEVYLNSFTHFSTMLIQKLSMNHNVKVYRFEEGYGSYLDEFSFIKLSTTFVFKLKSFISPFLGLTDVARQINGEYFFFPELRQYKSSRNVYKLPPFEVGSEKMNAFLRCAFGDLPADEFDKKYIFFEENITDRSIDDFGLVMKIAEKVGKENLMIKRHPRRLEDRFSKYGIKVSHDSGIPWEAILLQQDFSDKVLMTISSNVAFSSRLYLNQNMETYMLFKLFDKMNPRISNQEKFLGYIDTFRKFYDDNLFFVPDNEEIFMNKLS